MLAAFPQSQAESSLRMEAYFTALEGQPAWAIGEVCVAAIRGEGPGDGRFAPTPAEMARMVKATMTDMRADLISLERLLKAETEDNGPDSAERARVAAGLAKLASGIQPKEERRALSPDLDTSYLVDRQWREMGLEPDPWCSPALVALAKRQKAEEEAGIGPAG